MKAYIQHKDGLNQKLILQALVPFTSLKDSVLFTYRSTEVISGNEFQSSKFYQRRVDSKRSNEIKEFIKKSILLEKNGNQLATLFPTSMILALSVDEELGNNLTINDEDSCELNFSSNVFIVDGQHRMMGMIKLFNELSQFIVRTDEDDFVFEYLQHYKFNCTILVNYDLWEQGQVFVNVNFKQKSVNKSLYYEIFGSEYREDEKDWNRNQIYLSHNIAVSLNENPKSPFYQHIKMLGTGNGYVSQAFVVESLQRHFRRGGLWYFDPDGKTSVNYYATELISYFVAIKKQFSKYWPEESSTKGSIICKTTGFGAWLRLFGMMREDDDELMLKYLKESANNGEICEPYVERVIGILAPITKYGESLFGDNSEFKSLSGQGSESKLYKKILFYLQKPQTIASNKLPFDSEKLCEELQEYIWLTPIDELEVLGHHYEVENISEFRVSNYEEGINAFEVNVSFGIYVNIYLDNEDDSGFSMEFPATASILLNKVDNDYHLDENNITVSVNTDKYYE